MSNIKVSTSILSCDFTQLGAEIKKISNAKTDYIHFDIMDGNFVPNITYGWNVINSVRGLTSAVFDVHLMISNPETYIDKFAYAGADIITIHAEAVTHLDRAISQIHSTGKKAGVSIVPSTHESVLEYIYDKADLILVMTVNPGFGGQKFIHSQLEKINRIRNKINASLRDIDLEVDGGINMETGKLCVESGANVLVAGSYILSDGKYDENIKSLKALTSIT